MEIPNFAKQEKQLKYQIYFLCLANTIFITFNLFINLI